ncbi:hypothetical protein F183_A26910 [Bryobacterales bacterium F-183]|nr:hypothetical protein F183_A26910 [Bryobacterales bacterium F-183]
MIAIDQMTDEEFERRALDLLHRELGPDGVARFLRLNRSGTDDYTRDRENLQQDLTLDQILLSVEERRARGGDLRSSGDAVVPGPEEGSVGSRGEEV